MNKNSTSTTSDRRVSIQSAAPSRATLSRIRQFARSYVCFQQAAHVGGIILN
ncbi:MAG: hypothetical protein K2K77_05265 [Duncaniella sp.]|nr:hypothetical protein [Duncaniella sp.]